MKNRQQLFSSIPTSRVKLVHPLWMMRTLQRYLTTDKKGSTEFFMRQIKLDVSLYLDLEEEGLWRIICARKQLGEKQLNCAALIQGIDYPLFCLLRRVPLDTHPLSHQKAPPALLKSTTMFPLGWYTKLSPHFKVNDERWPEVWFYSEAPAPSR